ncbi:phosphopantetheine-binding protein [Actinosynnema sp. ALI-1.44]|uniref:acyl carrier protein n=1 Tax=Actinosynnema sp. ALI-1.44 TaxID=1933779 RepID=UPI00097C3006|nr:acyl carrier protein [Actinosynnema sp. ALI-1.44]ONI83207.1 phosphopantetheine-binding protein [Actinosynnema sp. ALI-1.44]
MWDSNFEQVLRDHLVFLAPDEALTEDLDLREHGLDSMGIVSAMVSLEQQYNFRFADSALNVETFATPGVLWRTITSTLAPSL